MAKLKVSVSPNRCIASGDCVETAPTIFDFGEDGKSRVVTQAGAPDNIVLAAARGCPTKAITVVDEETGEQLFPPLKK